MPRTAWRTAPLLPSPRRLMPNSCESDHSVNHRAQHVTNRCALTLTNHGEIVRRHRNSPDPNCQSAEFANSPCLKKPLTKQLFARLSFLTARGEYEYECESSSLLRRFPGRCLFVVASTRRMALCYFNPAVVIVDCPSVTERPGPWPAVGFCKNFGSSTRSKKV